MKVNLNIMKDILLEIKKQNSIAEKMYRAVVFVNAVNVLTLITIAYMLFTGA